VAEVLRGRAPRQAHRSMAPSPRRKQAISARSVGQSEACPPTTWRTPGRLSRSSKPSNQTAGNLAKATAIHVVRARECKRVKTRGISPLVMAGLVPDHSDNGASRLPPPSGGGREADPDEH